MVEFRSLQNIGWIRDASGNLTAIDTSGNTIAKFLGGVISAKGNIAGLNLTNTFTSSTTADVSTGFGVTITPQVSTRVSVILVGMAQTGLVTATSIFKLWHNSTSIPAGGSTPTGTNDLVTLALTAPTVNVPFAFSMGTLVTGLTVGTAYNFYVSYSQSAVQWNLLGSSGTFIIVSET